MPENRNIFLVGPMGTGKTTIGRQLARQLGMDFIDSDHAIEEHTGASVSLIFDIEGEAGFRKRERAIIDELTQRPDTVLATGGGVVLDPDNRADLVRRGTVIYLQTSINQLLKRTSHDSSRPLLQTGDPRAKLEQLILEREPLYREVADLIIKTGSRTVRKVVEDITAQLRNP